MKTNSCYLIILFLLSTLFLTNCYNNYEIKSREKVIIKGNYFGETLPNDTPNVFAPGIISTQYHEHSFPAFSPDGNTVLWNIEFMGNYIYDFPSKVSVVEMKNNVWSESEYFDAITLPMSGNACFSPDGNKIFFISDTSTIQDKRNYDIWFIE